MTDVVPAAVRADEVLSKFPEIILMISYDESSLVKEYLDKKNWPQQFHHVFDEYDPKCATTLLWTGTNSSSGLELHER
jgi:hypothetical protein